MSETAPEAVERPHGLGVLAGGNVVDLERLPMLHVVVDRLAPLLATGVRGFTGEIAEIAIDRAKPLTLKEFLGGLTQASMLAAIRIAPWDGLCLASLDARLIGTTVDLLLGGRRNTAPPGDEHSRPWTALERAAMERLTDEVIAAGLGRAFQSVGAAAAMLDQLDAAPFKTPGIRRSEAAIGFSADIAMDGRGGRIGFLIPNNTLKPMRDRLAQVPVDSKSGVDSRWRAHLGRELPQANVVLQALIERRRISTSDLLRWRVGTRLSLLRRHDEPIDVLCNELLVMRARIAEQDGRVALRVEDRRIADDWPDTA